MNTDKQRENSYKQKKYSEGEENRHNSANVEVKGKAIFKLQDGFLLLLIRHYFLIWHDLDVIILKPFGTLSRMFL